MSEYNAPFKTVLELEKRSLMRVGKKDKQRVIEKLFINQLSV